MCWLLGPRQLILSVVKLIAECRHAPQDLHAFLVDWLFDHHGSVDLESRKSVRHVRGRIGQPPRVLPNVVVSYQGPSISIRGVVVVRRLLATVQHDEVVIIGVQYLRILQILVLKRVEVVVGGLIVLVKVKVVHAHAFAFDVADARVVRIPEIELLVQNKDVRVLRGQVVLLAELIAEVLRQTVRRLELQDVQLIGGEEVVLLIVAVVGRLVIVQVEADPGAREIVV